VIATTVDESGTRRAVTKLVDEERRVSCSCCVEASECCMYPADQLGSGYTEDDLPNEVYVFVSDTNTPPTIYLDEILTRSGSEYTNGTGARLFVQVGLIWRIEIDDIPFSGRGCLIDSTWPFAVGGSELGVDSIQDTFLDTYEINFLTDKTVTVTRESLCSWFGSQMIGGFLYEASLAYNDETFQWEAGFSTVDIGSGNNAKDGNQNTPVGTYSGEYTITVSE
jgi:hypothetical protein